MKHSLTIAAAMALTLGAFADEPAATAAAPAATTTAAAAAAPADSPLVAAAKRANRKGRKPAHVITNDTLNKSGAGAHVTTTAQQRPFVMPKASPPPVPPRDLPNTQAREVQKSIAAHEEATKKAAEAQTQAAAAAAAAAEEGVYDDLETDPAQAERAQEDANRKPPQG
jgi:hypothetical protein